MDLLTRAVIISAIIAVILNRRNTSSGLHLGWGSGFHSRQASGSRRTKFPFRQINDSLYELEEPEPPVHPKMVILFFHGFYSSFHSSDSSDWHFSTWESGDGSCLWPNTWLVEKFDSARILYVSYNAVFQESSQGNIDMYNIAENLAVDLMAASIGETANCPVILVGHCFGGLVIKKLCLDMTKAESLARDERQRIKFENFLLRMKGVFYYGTPHKGSACVDKATYAHGDPFFKYFQILNKEASRLDSEFSQLCRRHPDWQIRGLGEGLPTKKGLFGGVVVAPEATSRGGDQYNVVQADHYSICKPLCKIDKRFYAMASLVDDIVKNTEVEILGHEFPWLPKHPVKLEERAQEVQHKLKDDSVPVLGIFGMGGIGKTTLAKQVYNNISKDFEYTCFLENVKNIQTTLEDRLLSQLRRHGRPVHGIQWADLKEKQTLIMLDDIDSEDHLSVFNKMDYFGGGSRIMVTCRDKEVLKVFEEYQIYEVNFLEMGEAKKLFCQHAFGMNDVPDNPSQVNNLESYVKRVVGKCDGLPLTLEVMGRYLRNRTMDVKIWEESLDRLGKALVIGGGKKDRVWASLELSYEALAEEEQKMFIEASTIFWDEPLSTALAAWSTVFDYPKSTWEALVNRSLVKESVSMEETLLRSWVNENFMSDLDSGLKQGPKKVWVHEHMRDLAKRLGKGIAERGLFAEGDKLLSRLNSNKLPEETRSLHISNTLTRLQVDPLARLKKLAYLQLHRVEIEGSRQNFPRQLSMLKWRSLPPEKIPSNIRELVSNIFQSYFRMPVRSHLKVSRTRSMLRFQQTERRPLFPISFNGMSNLAILELEGRSIPEGSLEELGKLTNLRMLTLALLSGLDSLPEDFGNLSQLEWLSLEDLSLRGLPESLGKLAALETLCLLRVECLGLPEAVGELSSLVTVVISCCPELASLPVSFGRGLSKLETLLIINCPMIECLPQSLGQISGLRTLAVLGCEGLKDLGHSFGGLSALECLIVDCKNVDELSDDFKLPASLKLLTWSLKKLSRLPDNIGDLTALQGLVIFAPIETLPENLGEFISLQGCRICSSNLVEVPKSLGQLAGLEFLYLDAPGLDALPDSLGDLSSLKVLKIVMDCLKHLPESVGRLQSLHKFTVSARRLTTVPDSIGQLSNLKKFELDCDGLERLPDRLELLPLSSLRLKLFGNNTNRLPDGLENLSTLRDLTLKFPKLTWLPDEFGNLPCLRRLQIHGCSSLEHLDSLGCIPSLRLLELKDCCELKRLPNSLGMPSSCQPTATEGLRLFVSQCDFLDDSRMKDLGWVIEKDSLAGKTWRRSS